MNEAMKAFVERNEFTITSDDLNDASNVIQLTTGRGRFTFERLCPPQLASALRLVSETLPTDDLSGVLAYACGVSGLLKLGTRIACSLDYSVPCNLWVAMVGGSGLAKTPVMQRLLLEPAKQIRFDLKDHHSRDMQNWSESCKGLKKDERPPAPLPLFPQLQDYTPERLAMQLEVHDAKGLGLLLIRDELSALLLAVDADERKGRGTAGGQLLELFDGTGSSSIRVGSDGKGSSRSFERCHVSVYGNIQPLKLKELINGKDHTGRYARFLLNKLPAIPLTLRDEDPTPEQQAAYADAQAYLAEVAGALFRLPPREYKLSADARKRYNHWFRQIQETALAPTTHPVISAMLGKCGAHALRLAGVLHILWYHDNDNSPAISLDLMQVAIEIVDQLTQETQLFHESPADTTLLFMRHIHRLSEKYGECTYSLARDKGRSKKNGGINKTATDFSKCVERLVADGYGELVTDAKNLTYKAIKSMPV